MIALVLAMLILLPMTALADPVIDSRAVQAQATRTAPLTIDEVLARIELTHPLLRATGVERTKARAKILKALGAWEPTFKNITEVDRYTPWNITGAATSQAIQTTGYNDSKLEVGHPWGFKVHGGIRNGFGDRFNQVAIAQVPDLIGFYHTQQLLIGGSFKLLRGLMINEEYAEFQ
ncbi:MAG: hypothetical protein KF693_08310, partial [Nitrospira sp.]|nr:hypothetical protein [Nitrospira sp.]